MDPVVEIVESRMLAAAVADEIVHSMGDIIEDHGCGSLVLSGGSTPGSMYRLLSHPPRVTEVQWDKVHIYWGDERWVPHDHHQSNYRLAEETLISHLKINNVNPHLYPIDTALSSPEEGAKAYAKTIKKIENINDDGKPVFDIVLLGLGTDGHVASLFPQSDVLSKNESICYPVKDPNNDEGYRVTLSRDLIFSAKNIIFMVQGDRKADIVKRALEGDESPDELPARFFLNSPERVSWFIDSAAAKKLEKSY